MTARCGAEQDTPSCGGDVHDETEEGEAVGGGEASVAVPNEGGISTPFRRRMSRFSRSRLSRSLRALSSGVAGRDDVPPMVAMRLPEK